jgi:hypothetical protein
LSNINKKSVHADAIDPPHLTTTLHDIETNYCWLGSKDRITDALSRSNLNRLATFKPPCHELGLQCPTYAKTYQLLSTNSPLLQEQKEFTTVRRCTPTHITFQPPVADWIVNALEKNKAETIETYLTARRSHHIISAADDAGCPVAALQPLFQKYPKPDSGRLFARTLDLSNKQWISDKFTSTFSRPVTIQPHTLATLSGEVPPIQQLQQVPPPKKSRKWAAGSLTHLTTAG